MSEHAQTPAAPAANAAAVSRAEQLLVDTNRWALIVLMAAMTVLVIANVFARYVFNHSIIWAEELSRYMMVWVGFLGSGLVLRVGAHIAVDVFQDMLPRRAAQVMRAAVVGTLAATLLGTTWLGVRYVAFAWGQETPVLNWNFGWIYVAIPLGLLLMLVHLVLIAVPYVRERHFRHDPAMSSEDATL